MENHYNTLFRTQNPAKTNTNNVTFEMNSQTENYF